MKIWFGRILIGFVLFFNLQCAIAFIIRPDLYVGGFELQGALGEAVVRSMGVLFLMWNVPYTLAFWNPARFRVSLCEAVIMQLIGVAGESAVLWLLPERYAIARSSILRFITFDTIGLAALAAAAWITRRRKA
jgi:hypothetical protein